MKLGIATDHGGFDLKNKIQNFLIENGYELQDYGAYTLDPLDDYPDFVIPLAKALQQKKIDRGIAICGSGVGACIAANKINGVRASLITEHFSAHQGVEDDDMNLICLGGRITGIESAKEIIATFLKADFKKEERYIRRLNKIIAAEK